MSTPIVDLCKQQFAEQVKWRRHFHRHPELSFQESETTRFIKKLCRQFGLKTLPLKSKTGHLAELKGKYKGKTIALRTDIDALPIVEKSGVKFASENPGCMHACGHDMHMATVLGAAAVLSNLKDQLHGNVRFIFQHAEEMPPGGAIEMIQNDCLKDVDMIIGLHVDPLLGSGKISLRDGPCMASVTDFDLTIHGKGGHAARPQDAVDALVVASEIVLALQTVVSRKTDPISPVAITVGKIEGGRARNVIPDEVRITATARALTVKSARDLPKQIKKTAGGICKAHGASMELDIVGDYPVLYNHPKANRLLRRNYEGLFGLKSIEETDQVLGGEDFARYLEKVPGAMFRVGVGNPKIGANKTWHSPHFKADEEGLLYGTSLLCATVLDFLAG